MFSYPVMENILLHPLRYIFQNTCFFNRKQISVFYGKQISVFYGKHISVFYGKQKNVFSGKQKYVSLLQVGNRFWDFGPLLGPFDFVA
jgi:hypothetical protein